MKKMVKTLLCLMMALAMSLSLAVPAFAVPCEHDYYDTVSVWYTDNGANHIQHRRVTTRCHKCSYTNEGPESRTISVRDIGPWGHFTISCLILPTTIVSGSSAMIADDINLP